MQYANHIEKKSSNRNYTFNKLIEENFKKGVDLVSGGKIFGEEIDTTNLKEVVAALYIMYTYKDYMVNTDDKHISDIGFDYQEDQY